MRPLLTRDGFATALVAALVSATAFAQQPKVRKVFDIAPLQLEKGQVEKKLPSAIGDVCIGGGGRFLILHFPTAKKIGIFDVCKGDVVHSIAADDDQVMFAAGMEKLFVHLGNSSFITRYSLDTFRSEAAYRVPAKSKVDGLHIGSASYGPLMVTGLTPDKRESMIFLNIANMSPANYASLDAKTKVTFFGSDHTIRVSANGTVFTYWDPHATSQGFNSLVLSENSFRTHREKKTFGHLCPGADGQVIYTARGPVTPEGRPMGEPKNDNKYKLEYTIPASEGNLYYMSVGTTPNRQAEALNLHFVGERRPFATLTDVELPAEKKFSYDRDRMGLEKRLILIPSAELFVSIPLTNDRLVLQKFTLEKYLKDSPFNFLVVTSKAPSTCRRDAVYNYNIKAMSKAGGIKFRTVTAPTGMTMTEDGKISWRVPFQFAAPKQHVLVMVTDAGGLEKPHSFDIAILDRTP